MTKYREILRLKSLGFSERNIALSCGVSRNTVAKVIIKVTKKVALLVRTGGSRHTGLAAPPHCNIHYNY